MKFTLEFDCSNAAFGETPDECAEEICRILADMSKRLSGWHLMPSQPLTLRDSNGNRVGFAKFEATP